MLMELLPISTALTMLTTEIVDVAIAAQDVLVDKDTYTVVSKHIHEILPVLKSLDPHKLEGSQAAREALTAIELDIRKARGWVDLYKTRSQFYKLVHCRNIVKQAEQIIRDIGKSLALLSLASTEVAMDIRHNVEELGDQMQHVEFQASQQKLEIINKIELGIQQHNTDQVFVNGLLRDIARAVGVPVEESEIRKQLASLEREKEEAAVRKEREEEVYMEQIIALLSNADAAHSQQDVRRDYKDRWYIMNSSEELPPLPSFKCPLTKEVMLDPVTITSDKTYERAKIEEWFDKGNKTDPQTKELLSDLSLKPNNKIKECIIEWRNMNYCIRIQIVKRKLASVDETDVKQALEDLCELCDKNSNMRSWISEEHLVADIVIKLKSGNKEIKKKSLLALRTIISGDESNKKQLLDAGGVESVVHCLSRDISISKLAVSLLLELLQGKPSHAFAYKKLSEVRGAIILLVTLHNGNDLEASQNAKQILEVLIDRDEKYIVEMAKANWYTPLIEHLSHGSLSVKIMMAEALSSLDLRQMSIQTLGGGVIASLVKMMSETLEAKGAALKALESLSCLGPNKTYLAEAGAVPLVLEHLFSGSSPMTVRESAGAILENLVLAEGDRFLVDVHGNPIDLGNTIQKLLMVQENSSKSSKLQKHVLLSLLGLVSSDAGHESRRLIKEFQGVSKILSLLEYPDPEIRDAAVQVVYCVASDNAGEISCFLLQKRLIGLLVRLLNNATKLEIQAASAGILASLPLEEKKLTADLIEVNALPAIMHVLRYGDPKCKESAAGALLRFTLPSDMELQKRVVEQGIYHILKGLLNSGTQLAKARAANALQNLSKSTLELCVPPSFSGCFLMFKKPPSLCRVHPGQCGEKTTFCLVESEVVPDLVSLLKEWDSDAAGAAVDALSTLVTDGILEKGATLLHETKAIECVLALISHGTDLCKEKGLNMLHRLFKIKKLREYYGNQARILLVDLATNGKRSVARQAAEVLALLQVIHEASTYF